MAEEIATTAKKSAEFHSTIQAIRDLERKLAELGGRSRRYDDLSAAPSHRYVELAVELLDGKDSTVSSLQHAPEDVGFLVVVLMRLFEFYKLDGVLVEILAFVLANIYARIHGIDAPSSAEMAIVEVAARPDRAVTDDIEIQKTLERWKKRMPGKDGRFDDAAVCTRAAAIVYADMALREGGTGEACAAIAARVAKRYRLNVAELSVALEEETSARLMIEREQAEAAREEADAVGE